MASQRGCQVRRAAADQARLRRCDWGGSAPRLRPLRARSGPTYQPGRRLRASRCYADPDRSNPSRITTFGHVRIAGVSSAAGSYLLRVRYTPYWDVIAGDVLPEPWPERHDNHVRADTRAVRSVGAERLLRKIWSSLSRSPTSRPADGLASPHPVVARVVLDLRQGEGLHHGRDIVPEPTTEPLLQPVPPADRIPR